MASSQAKYHFIHLTTEEGIADNTINDIIQDRQGFMWFATNNGLQRYDGHQFRDYHFDFVNKNSLPSDVVAKLMEDDEGNVWAACNTGVAVISKLSQKPQRKSVVIGGKEVQMIVSQLFEDSRKNIWLVSQTHGIFLFDKKTQQFVSNNIAKWFNWRTRQMVEEPATGNFWLACDSGIAYLDVKAQAMYNYSNNPLHLALLQQPELFNVTIAGLAIDASNTFWINTVRNNYQKSAGIRYAAYSYNVALHTLSPYQSPAKFNHTYVIDREKNLWIVGDNIIAINQGNKFIRVDYVSDDSASYKTDILRCFYVDRQHNRWIGTDNGVFAFNAEEAKIKRGLAFSAKQQPLEATVKSVLELADKKIWIATTGHGILEYSFNFKPLKQYSYLGDDDISYANVWSLYRAKNGKIWIGCEAGRVMIYDPTTQKFEKLTPNEFGLRTIRTITEDQQSNIWFGTQYGIIVKYDVAANRFMRYADFSAQGLGNINHLMVDKNNNLWACTAGFGLLKMDVTTGKVIEQYQHSSSDLTTLSGNLVRRILEYNDSTMVVSATGINLFNTRTKKFTYITTADGLPSNNVAGLVKDAASNIWAGLNGALVKLSMPSKKVQVFAKSDGIVNTGFQQGAMQVLSDGRLVAGTLKDFIYLDPRDFRSNQPPPDVRITSFRVFQQELNIDSILMHDDNIHLLSDQNFVAIDFSSLTYLNNKLYYYYKLQGVDKDWVKTTNLSAVYPYLRGGAYTFMVRCENGDGVSSRHIATLKIYIRPPFYERWWFFLLLAALTAGVLYFFHRVRVNRILDMQKVRGRIARDLHDDMGSTLSTINILSEMAKFKIDKDTDVTKDYIAKISDNSHRMMEAMDDIVWSINPMNDNMQKITARMREYATSLLEAKDIDYTFHVDEAVKHIKLDMEARRDFFLIFKEAVNNLVKYSQCKHAHIKIETYEYSLTMKIQDDGIGFIVADADSGNGLSNMQKRAQSLNAKLSVKSKPGVGTKILLEVIFA